MESIFVNYLFSKNILVAQDQEHYNQVDIWMALAKLFNIRVGKGYELLEPKMINTAEENIGVYVPEPFYRGFPASVKEMLPEQLLWDQALHYLSTYGTGNFTGPASHSIFEKEIKRKVFDEEAEIKDFTVITEAEAEEMITSYVDQLLSGTRPLSGYQYELVREYLKTYQKMPDRCASKNTAIRLICDIRDPKLAKFIVLSDVIKLAEELAYRHFSATVNPYRHKRFDPKKIKLTNQDRKLITKILDRKLAYTPDSSSNDIVKAFLPCFEQMARWSGLLHHIHYKPKNNVAKQFLGYMRGKTNYSISASFERAMQHAHAEGTNYSAVSAARYLLSQKGQGALLRNLDYILSKCWDDKEIAQVISLIDTRNVIMLYQLILHYHHERPKLRTFKYIKHGLLQVYHEKPKDNPNRGTRFTTKHEMGFIYAALGKNIRELLRDRLGKVYISPEMKRIALPIQEGTASGGYGTLTRGSRIHIPEGKKIRAFTYWEKVDDIDLSVIGLDEEQQQTEFSWRSMLWLRQSEAIAYSGDVTNGYNGGSEFFDINPEAFKKEYPNIRYLVFCNNVYSGRVFKDCVCRAGYMTRDINDSGQVFEPKTVKSSFTINCESTFAYLFAIDLKTNDFIWLNTTRDSNARVAGATDMSFITQYFDILDTINVYDFFAMQAREIVDKPEDAELIVSDEMDHWLSYGTEVIHSFDTERMIQLMNA